GTPRTSKTGAGGRSKSARRPVAKTQRTTSKARNVNNCGRVTRFNMLSSSLLRLATWPAAGSRNRPVVVLPLTAQPSNAAACLDRPRFLRGAQDCNILAGQAGTADVPTRERATASGALPAAIFPVESFALRLVKPWCAKSTNRQYLTALS